MQKRPANDDTEFLNAVALAMGTLVKQNERLLPIDTFAPFKDALNKIKSRNKTPIYSAKAEGKFLYVLSVGLHFIKKFDLHSGRSKAEQVLDKQIEMLVKTLHKKHELLNAEIFSDIKIENPFDLNQSDNFSDSLKTLLITVRNRKQIAGLAKINQASAFQPPEFNKFIREFNMCQPKDSKTNYRAFAVFLSKEIFGKVRYSFLLKLLSHPTLVKYFTDESEVHQDMLTMATDALKKQRNPKT